MPKGGKRKGAGRKPAQVKYERLCMTLLPSERAEITDYAKQTGGTVSGSLRALIQIGLVEAKKDVKPYESPPN